MTISRLLLFLLVLPWVAGAQSANRSTRMPPPGIAISNEDRKELEQGAAELATAIAKLRAKNSADVIDQIAIFHKAVHWALVYDEFYRSNEVAAAKTLLQRGMERAEALRGGQQPWLSATGLVVRAYRSRIDNSIQPYGLVVPPSFGKQGGQKYRLDVWLHGRDAMLTELKFMADRQRSYGEFAPPETIVLHPYGRYCNAFKFAGEIDVFEAIEHVRRNYPIDDARVSIRGFSMGGGGAWHLAAHYPSFWTAAAPGAGFSETPEFTRIFSKSPGPAWYEQTLWHLYDATDYAANFLNCPVIAYSGELDRQKQAADIMAKAMEREGLQLPHLIGPKTEHKYEPGTKVELEQQFSKLVEKGRPVPDRVHFTTYTLRYNSNYWVRVDGMERHWERADVELAVGKDASQRAMEVKTTNVSALTLSVSEIQKKWPSVSDLRIDDTLIAVKTGVSEGTIHLRKNRGGWSAVPASKNRERHPERRKRHGLQGPIDDAFVDSFIMVRPTGKPMNEKSGAWVQEELARATNEWRSQFRGDVAVKEDTQITDKDIEANNLVLWGDPQSNRLLGRIAGRLPIRWRRGTVEIAGEGFDVEKFAPVMIYPNPLNVNRYVVLNSGFTFAEVGKPNNALQVPKLPDYAVIDIGVPITSRIPAGVPLAGFFDDEWNMPTTRKANSARSY